MKADNIHTSNLIYAAICLLGIFAFFFVGIFPNINTLREMDQEIEELNVKVQTQELLYPVYLKLLAEITHKIPTKLSVPDQNKISHSDLSQINETFLKLARENEVAFINAIPDASNYLEDTGLITVNASFSGDFFKLRKLLLHICRLPYLASIDEMRVDTARGKKRISFKLKVAQE